MAQKELELKKIKVEQENASFYGGIFTPVVKKSNLQQDLISFQKWIFEQEFHSYNQSLMERKKLEASIKQLSETVRFNETDLEEKFVQQEKEYVLRSNQTQREINSKSNICVNALRIFSTQRGIQNRQVVRVWYDVMWVRNYKKIILEHVDILKQSYADETENVIDRVSKIHTRENMRLRRKLTKENKKSLAIMDENTHLRRELRKNEIDNSIFLG